MKKIILFIFLVNSAAMISAQTYQWQWAKQGGGDNGSTNVGFNAVDDEFIRDVVVDSDNNFYYLSAIYPGNPKLNGVTVTNYNNRDLFLFSTDCSGNIRWSRTIGGYTNNEHAWKLEVDNNGGLYIMTQFVNQAYNTSSPNILPPRFDESNAMPIITIPFNDNTSFDAGLKTTFLLKYNTSNGTLAWQKPLQGNVNIPFRFSENAVWTMDSNKNIHAIIGFLPGTHLNDLITVPSTFSNAYQYYLVKFNYDNGNMTPAANPMVLPINGFFTPGLIAGKVNFLFDEALNRYYISGARDADFTGQYTDISYNNVPFINDGYMLAINGSNGAELWRKEFSSDSSLPDNKMYGLIKDSSSNLYISGYYLRTTSAPATFGTYVLPSSSYGFYTPFVMKLNSSGDVQWTKIPDALSSSQFEGYRFARSPIVLNGNEIAFVKGSIGDTWGTYTMSRPQNDSSDPLLVRLNKDTGAVLGTNEIKSDFGQKDEMTAVAVDNDGNYVVGGFFHNQLFTDANDNIPTITSSSISGKSNFFFAKLAKSACSALGTAESEIENNHVSFYPNPTQDFVIVSTKNALQNFAIYSTAGQLVIKGKFDSNDNKIPTNSLPSGNYIINITTDKGKLSGKVIKK